MIDAPARGGAPHDVAPVSNRWSPAIIDAPAGGGAVHGGTVPLPKNGLDDCSGQAQTNPRRIHA